MDSTFVRLQSVVLILILLILFLCLKPTRLRVPDDGELNGGGRVLTAADRFQGTEVTIAVNGRLPKEQITVHIKAAGLRSFLRLSLVVNH